MAVTIDYSHEYDYEYSHSCCLSVGAQSSGGGISCGNWLDSGCSLASAPTINDLLYQCRTV